MRVITHIAVSYLLVVVMGAVWRATPFEIIQPSIALVCALYLGVSTQGWLAEATAGVIVLGWLVDVLSAAPRGLGAIVLGASCITARVLSGRLLLRGRLFVAVFAFVFALFAAVVATLLRLAFDAPIGPALGELAIAFGSALLTALVAPPLFRLHRLVDARFARTEREREAVKEGFH
jgi:cell shape-determining protein MreD